MLAGYATMNEPYCLQSGIAAGGETRFAYDGRDNVVLVTDPEGRDTSYSYSAKDEEVLEKRDGTPVWERTYQRGRLEREENALGAVRRYQYDGSGRLTKRSDYPAGTTTASREVSFAYDPQGRYTGYADEGSSESRSYDSQGRLATVTTTLGTISKSVGYSYTADGEIASYTNPEGVAYRYGYDAEGKIEGVVIPGEGVISGSNRAWQAPKEMTLPGGSRIHTQRDGLERETHPPR